MQLHVRAARAHRADQRAQIRKGPRHLLAAHRELLSGPLQNRGFPVEVDQGDQGIGAPCVDFPCVQQLARLRPGLALQRFVQGDLPFGPESGAARKGTEDPDVPDVEMHRPDARRLQRLQHQADDFAVALPPGVAVELRTHLHRAAAAGDAFRQGVQHRARVAQARGAVAAQPPGVDTGDLRGHVRPDPHHPARELVDQLEGMELQILAGAGQQRLQVLDEGRGDDLVAPEGEQIEQRTPHALQVQRLRRHQLLHALRQQPAFRSRLHGAEGGGGRGTFRAPVQRTT